MYKVIKLSLNKKKLRKFTQIGFFLLFLLAPILDVFRLDLTQGHFILLFYSWTLGLDNLQFTNNSALETALTLLLHVFIPVLLFLAVVMIIVWKWGRLYCGWLCPHFSVVESINQVMLIFLHRVTLWEPVKGQPEKKGSRGIIDWFFVVLIAVTLAFVWAFSLLSYLLPPKELINDLIHLQLGTGSTRFLLIATFLFSIDFIFARHFFCRYGCAVGLFQSIIWMGNKKALKVTFNKELSAQCKTCDNECDASCPMRLKPRGSKRSKFNCTQCGVCLTTCDSVSAKQNNKTSTIRWSKSND